MISSMPFMEEAIKECQASLSSRDVPVGCVIVDTEKMEIIARGKNGMIQKDGSYISVMHAEICAILEASKKYRNIRFESLAMYVTLFPCMMCMGAILNSRIKELYVGCSNPKEPGADFYLSSKKGIDLKIYEDISTSRCQKLIQDFFKDLR